MPKEVSDQLFEFEQRIWDDKANNRRCEVIAAMFCHFGPHPAQRDPKFWVCGIAEDTAYQCALRTAIQARIQMYLKAWGNAAALYQELAELTAKSLPSLQALRGASFNNWGVAQGMSTKLDMAITCFETAITALNTVERSTCAQERAYLDVLENLISALEYRECFDAARLHYEALINALIRSEGEDSNSVLEAKTRMLGSTSRGPKNVPLTLRRLPIEGDGPGVIRGAIDID